MRYLLLSALVLAGCAPRITAVPMRVFEARPADHPIEFFADDAPPCDYIEVGPVTARKPNFLVSMDETIEALRAAAREMGGDAVIHFDLSESDRGAVVRGELVDANIDPMLSGLVIRYTEACGE